MEGKEINLKIYQKWKSKIIIEPLYKDIVFSLLRQTSSYF